MEEVRNLIGLKILKIAYIQRRNLLKNLKLIDAQMAKDNIKACSGLEVLTHIPKVSIHETQKHSRSRHIHFEESTHMDSSQSKNRSVNTFGEIVDT